MGVGFGLNTFADTAWFYGLAVLVWTLGEMLNSPSNSATNAELSPAGMRGRYQGVFSLSWSSASFIAPILGAALLEHAGAAALWASCFGLAMVVAVLHLVSGPSREHRAAELRAGQAPLADNAPIDDTLIDNPSVAGSSPALPTRREDLEDRDNSLISDAAVGDEGFDGSFAFTGSSLRDGVRKVGV
jgi:MFS family permease